MAKNELKQNTIEYFKNNYNFGKHVKDFRKEVFKDMDIRKTLLGKVNDLAAKRLEEN